MCAQPVASSMQACLHHVKGSCRVQATHGSIALPLLLGPADNGCMTVHWVQGCMRNVSMACSPVPSALSCKQYLVVTAHGHVGQKGEYLCTPRRSPLSCWQRPCGRVCQRGSPWVRAAEQGSCRFALAGTALYSPRLASPHCTNASTCECCAPDVLSMHQFLVATAFTTRLGLDSNHHHQYSSRVERASDVCLMAIKRD
jgi:hypothetical protein